MGLKVLSLFDGISCGLVALNRAEIEVDAYDAFEIDKYAIQISKKNHSKIIHHGGISEETDFTKFKGHDLLIGGFPCQSYSVAGKQLGLEDPRGQLIYQVFRALKETQVPNFMLENVKGLVTHNKGNTFRFILNKLNDCGYAVDFRSINSSLVSAQNRERIYIIGKRLDLVEEIFTSELSKKEIKDICNKG